MATFRILSDGTIVTDSADDALELSAKIAERIRAAPRAIEVFDVAQGTSVKATLVNTPVATPSASPRGTPKAPPTNVPDKVAALILHARENPDTLAILETLKAAEGRSIDKSDLIRAIGLDDVNKLAGKIAGIVKTCKRLGLNPDAIFLRLESGYAPNKLITYRAGIGLLGSPPVRAATPTAGGSAV